MSDAAADPTIEGPGGRRFPLVWLAPLVALGVALFLVWREYDGRGPLIEIAFPSADGIVAGETTLRYRSVEVGRVETIRFTPDLGQVIAEVRLSPDVARFVDADASFWIVRPEVSARGISGLETVISGAYIEGAWDSSPGVARSKFEALANPPLTPPDTPGKRVTLRAADGGSLNIGAPVLYRGVEVGRVEARRLTEDGAAVEFDVFVRAPNDARLTGGTRFWNVSGVDLSFGADGARLRIASLASLIQGGATFEDLSGGAASAVEPGHVFNLYPSEQDARAEELDVEAGERLLLDVYFDGSVRGLSVGAPVEYQGIRIGRVTSVSAEVDPREGLFATRTTIAIAPSRLGLEEANVEGALAFLDKAVARGLRAQLATANLLTGSLLVRFIEETFPPSEALGVIERREDRPPRMPATQTDLDELAGSVEGALKRVERLPFEELFTNAVLLLENLNAVVGSDATRQAPEEALGLLVAARALLSDEALQRAPAEAEALLKSLREAIDPETLDAAQGDLAALLSSARDVAETLAEQGTAGEAAAAVAALRALLEDPALARLPEGLAGAVDGANAILADEALRQAPAEAAAALAALRETLESQEIARARVDLAALLASARSVADTLAAEDVAGEAAAAAAALRARLDDPNLTRLATTMTETLDAAGALLSSPSLRAAPGQINETLESLRRILDAPGFAEAPEELRASLAAARDVLEQVRRENAAGEIAAAAASARALLDDPALRRLADEAAGAAAALRSALGAENAGDLPEAASRALDATTRFFDQLREAGLADQATRTLASIDAALAGAPQLVDRLSAAATRADGLLASLDVGSELNYETVTAIREIRDAARAITDLAALFERQPNAIILGR